MDPPEQGLPAAPATTVGGNRPAAPAAIAASTPPVRPSATKRHKKNAQEVCVDTEIMKYLNNKNTQEDAGDDEDAMFIRSLAKSCQKLTTRTRSILKMRMYSLMHEAEMRLKASRM